MRSFLPACLLLLALTPALSLHLPGGAALPRSALPGSPSLRPAGPPPAPLAARLKGGASTAQVAPQSGESMAGALKKIFSMRNIAVFFVVATAASFYQVKTSDTVQASGDDNQNYVMGLLLAGVALFGNAGVSALRKMLSQHDVGSAQQVGLACLIQGVVAVGFCFHKGILKAGPDFVEKLPPKAFWGAAIGASVLNSVVKTLETKAFSETDLSLCTPFLAFDPVMQFLVGIAVMPAACRLMGLGCDDLKASFPPYHILSVICIAFGAFMLGGQKASGDKAKSVQMLGPLPVGSWYILLNCVIYSFTSRMDKLAIKSSGKTLYYAYGRLLMAGTTLGGSLASGVLGSKELAKFTNPKVATLLLGVCVADAVYMLSLYQAFAWISPVYVTAVKRGGGILLSSLLGVLLFGESMAGRFGPILTIVIGVTFLCL